MNFPVISLVAGTKPNKLMTKFSTYLWNLIGLIGTKLNLILIKPAIVSSYQK